MSSLVRTKSSVFSLESAKTIDEIKEFAEKSNIADLIIPIDTLFADFKEIILNQDDTAKMLNGMFLPTPFCDGKYRVYSHDKKFICIGEAENNILKIVKNFYAQ